MAERALRRWRKRWPVPRSVRARLLLLVLAPLLIGVPVLLGIVWVWGTHGYDRLLVNKVSADLLTARQYFERVQQGVAGDLAAVASSHALALALQGQGPDSVEVLLDTSASRLGLDYLLFLDPQGRVTVPSAPLPSALAERGNWPAVRSALQGRAEHTLAVFPPEHLEALDPALRAHATLGLVPTQRAAPDPRPREERGLMVQVAVPVTDLGGRLLGVLEGGVMLNRNLGIVDRINAAVYQDSSLPLDSQGTATLFLDDIRIATNVRLFEGSRALGTRVSAAVRDKVLGRGETWLGSAFVVNADYISGYAPLFDGDGKAVGMLYVGFLQAPLQQALYLALGGLFLVFLLLSGLGTLAAVRWARSIFQPIERMAAVMGRIESGEEQARVGAVVRDDELGGLARSFDRLLDLLAARRAELQRWGQELDSKVAARTAELEAANATLRRAHQQLVMNEKLTAIGELTAGVAHEINNPVAVIQGNLELVRELLGGDSAPVADELAQIDAQVGRIHGIVTKLLQFARPGDFAGYTEQVDASGLVGDCLLLTRHNLSRGRIEVTTALDARGTVEINRGELQQVLINLIVNAMQAMPDGGRLRLSTADIDEGGEDDDAGHGAGRNGKSEHRHGFAGVCIRVEDTGCGIAADDLDRIFDPFFTTKKQEGTGLGLSISYAIVTRYGGHLNVDSQPGQGTRFTVCLRREARFDGEPSAPGFASRFFRSAGIDNLNDGHHD
ncbi:cache domain-containing protein [Azoarcus olearius]|uniref:histidine kinase n=1 Tax=Azoarcus sp. (strain BH72) TaxID=418699 RepID=A1K1I5_AZOSB|nr:cache domain-containing protein [Azoarcus olearius]CAL92690.1 putative sensor histidine kinase [Azoarcus olearius]